MNQLRVDLRTFVKQLDHTLCNPRDNGELIHALEDLQCLLVNSPSSNICRFRCEDVASAKQCFAHEHYTRFAYLLINQFNVDWLSRLPKDKIKVLVDNYFLYGKADDVFLILCSSSLDKDSSGFKENKCVSLMEEFLQFGGLNDVLLNQCSTDSHRERLLWDELILSVVSLPDKMAAKFKRENSDLFYPKNFIPHVSTAILNVMNKCYHCLTNQHDFSLEFVSRLVGKICISGYSDLLWSTLLPELMERVQTDYIWCRITERVITGVPDRCVEAVMRPLIKTLPWYGNLSKFLGDSVVKNKKVQYLLCTKMLLFQHTEKVLVLHNIFGYLASSHTRKPLQIKALKSLLAVWGDRSSLSHTPYEQHLYITKAIIICAGFLTDDEKAKLKQDLLQLLMPGVQCHIASADQRIRKVGMVLAEVVTKAMDPTGPGLTFEYEKGAEVDALFSLLVPPVEPSIRILESKICSVNLDKKQEFKENLSANNIDIKSAVAELDSDDDLEPYDMSNDVPKSKMKPPKYIRECMEGLMVSDDPDRVEMCLAAAESLVRSTDLASLTEISADFAKILLHLNDEYSSVGFISMRFKALMAITVTCPMQVASYLTNEFYERNYNIRQRLDILEVLAASAQELSRPSSYSSTNSNKTNSKIQDLTSNKDTETWQEIVQRRIDSKTRRFGKGRTKPEPTAVANRFVPVAGYFFYPLMKNYDRCDKTFDLLGDDSLVLGRLVYTLGMLMYSATNSPTIRSMAVALLEFIWILRFHPDQSVRKGLLFALSMVYLAVPSYILLSDLQAEVMESKSWLQDVVEKDADNECKRLALQAIVLLENTVKQAYEHENQGT